MHAMYEFNVNDVRDQAALNMLDMRNEKGRKSTAVSTAEKQMPDASHDPHKLHDPCCGGANSGYCRPERGKTARITSFASLIGSQPVHCGDDWCKWYTDAGDAHLFLLPYANVLTKRRVFQLINAERGLRR
jgi:hypothetical protein